MIESLEYAQAILAGVRAAVDSRDIHTRQSPGSYLEVWADGKRVDVHSRKVDAERTIRKLLGVSDADAWALIHLVDALGRPGQ